MIDLTQDLSPYLNNLALLIWATCVVDFALRFMLSPNKLAFLRRDWFAMLSLFIPALRMSLPQQGEIRALWEESCKDQRLEIGHMLSPISNL